MSLPPKTVSYHILKSPYYAFSGLIIAFKREPNLTLQLTIGISFAILGIFYGRWIAAMANLILMSIVISLEMLNTAIETLCDLVHPSYSPQVKIIKDIAAGSVLMVSLTWLVVIIYQILAIFVLRGMLPI